MAYESGDETGQVQVKPTPAQDGSSPDLVCPPSNQPHRRPFFIRWPTAAWSPTGRSNCASGGAAVPTTLKKADYPGATPRRRRSSKFGILPAVTSPPNNRSRCSIAGRRPNLRAASPGISARLVRVRNAW